MAGIAKDGYHDERKRISGCFLDLQSLQNTPGVPESPNPLVSVGLASVWMVEMCVSSLLPAKPRQSQKHTNQFCLVETTGYHVDVRVSMLQGV